MLPDPGIEPVNSWSHASDWASEAGSPAQNLIMFLFYPQMTKSTMSVFNGGTFFSQIQNGQLMEHGHLLELLWCVKKKYDK